jgi:GAF domain-containing protein
MLVNDHDELLILASKGMDPNFAKTYRCKIGEGIAGTVAGNRRPVLVRNIDNDGRFQGATQEHYRTGSFISCPLMIKERLLGVLNINDKKDRTPFTDDEFELMVIVANHAAIALENASLLAQLRSKAAELEEINQKLIETDIGKTEFLTRVSHELRTPLNSAKGAIYHLQQADCLPKNEQQEFQHIVATELDKLIAIVENLLNFLRLENETRFMRKTVIDLGGLFKTLSNLPRVRKLITDRGIRLGLPAADELPEIVGDAADVAQLFSNLITGLAPYIEPGDTLEIIAQAQEIAQVKFSLPRPLPEPVLSALNKPPLVLQDDHPENLLKLSFARSTAGLHHWKVNAENSDCGCLIALTIPKSAHDKVDAFVDKSMDSFVEFITELLHLDICSIMLTDGPTSELTVRSARGLDDDVVKRTRIKFGDKIAGWVALEGKPLFVENIENDPRFLKKSISQYSTKSFMSLPLKIDNRVVGVLNLSNKKTSEPFTLSDYYIASLVSERISQFMKLITANASDDDEFSRFLSYLSPALDAAATRNDRPDPLSI